MERIRYEAGPNQLIILYVTDDTSSQVDPGYVWSSIATDAAAAAEDGWQIVATAAMPLRQMGTAGNVFFQSGGQYATQAAVAVTYRRP